MKKKILAIILTIVAVLASTIPSFAACQVYNDVYRGRSLTESYVNNTPAIHGDTFYVSLAEVQPTDKGTVCMSYQDWGNNFTVRTVWFTPDDPNYTFHYVWSENPNVAGSGLLTQPIKEEYVNNFLNTFNANGKLDHYRKLADRYGNCQLYDLESPDRKIPNAEVFMWRATYGDLGTILPEPTYALSDPINYMPTYDLKDDITSYSLTSNTPTAITYYDMKHMFIYAQNGTQPYVEQHYIAK